MKNFDQLHQQFTKSLESMGGALVMAKAHVKGYTKSDGTFVAEHDDKRTAAVKSQSGDKESGPDVVTVGHAKIHYHIEKKGDKHAVIMNQHHADGQKFQTVHSIRDDREVAESDIKRHMAEWRGEPLPPGTYHLGEYNGKRANGLTEKAADIEAQKRSHAAEPGDKWNVVKDKSNPGKFAVRLIRTVAGKEGA